MEVVLYTYTKRENSTALPNSGTNFNCNLKADCSIISPRITIQTRNNPTGFNYAYIISFGRYYFISDWVYSPGYWEAYLKIDVLASWRSDILNSTQYVLRSASNSDSHVIDTIYPAKSGAVKTAEVSSSFTGWPNNITASVEGTYVVGIVAPQPWLSEIVNPYGIQYVAMTSANFTKLMNKLLSVESYGSWLDDAKKAAFNPFQFIVSVKWFPFDIGRNPLAAEQTSLNLGWYTFTGVTSYLPYANPRFSSTLGELSPHPQSERGEYLNKAPYRTVYCSLPGYGTIVLSTDSWRGETAVNCDVDIITGAARYYIINNGIQIASVDTEIGVNIPIAQISTNIFGGVSSGVGIAANLAANLAAGNYLGAVAGTAVGVGNAIETVAPQAQSKGTPGTRAILLNNPMIKLWAIDLLVVDEDNEDRGRPLCKKVVLSTLSGYTLVADADIKLSGTASEQTMIKNFMEGGFFLE